MFMAAFVLSVYVYLRRKEGCLAQASFVGVLRAKPDKKAINRKEEYEGKEEYEKKIMQQVLSTKEVRQQTIYFL